MAVFTNQATLSYNDVVTSSNIVTGELVQVLSLGKTALNDSYGANDTITYVVSIVNAGTTAFSDLTITDDLGAYEFGGRSVTPLTYEGDILFYINGVLQSTPSVESGPPLVVSGIDVPASSSALLIYRASINSFAPLATDASVTNTVTLTGTGITTPITAQETVSASSDPMLTISKAIFPSTVAENGEITYTFIIENSGNTSANADANAVVTDLFDPILSNIEVTLNGRALSPGAEYTYNETSGLFRTVEGVITVPAATYAQNPETGMWDITPGVAVLTVSGNL